MSLSSTFTLDSLLATHDSPFMIIDQHQKVVAVNDAWERHSGISLQEQIGKPCCEDDSHCRHRQFFQNYESYSGILVEVASWYGGLKKCLVSGYPIRDTEGKLYIGESWAKPEHTEINSFNTAMIGISPAFVKLKAKLQQIAKSNVPVLLTGETGTGKEVAAKFIHMHSNEANGEFIVVDCTLLTESLCESELFGHEKGAFTNAMNSRKGLFEMAHNGTLFLDEIGELPLSQQPKLLRALESGQFRRVGGNKTLSSKVRVICATHRHLGEMVKAGTFREDLFYRLSVLTVEIPPLRERKQDLPLLAEHLLRQDGSQHLLTQLAINKLLHHSWPGNIRELKNCLQLAVSMASSRYIDKQEIHILRRRARASEGEGFDNFNVQLKISNPLQQAESEREKISQLITKFQGNRKLIAADLAISERTLYRKLNRYGIG